MSKGREDIAPESHDFYRPRRLMAGRTNLPLNNKRPYNLATLQSYIIVSFQQITFSFFVKPLCTAKGEHAKFT